MRSRLSAQNDWQCLKRPLLRVVVQDGACNDGKETPRRQKVISYMNRIGRYVLAGHSKIVRTKCIGYNAAHHLAFREDPGFVQKLGQTNIATLGPRIFHACGYKMRIVQKNLNVDIVVDQGFGNSRQQQVDVAVT